MTKQSKTGERIEEAPPVHLTDEQMRGYQSRTLSVEERSAAGIHLAGCGACRYALLARMGRVEIPAEAAALREPLHLEFEELTALLDGTLAEDERTRAEDHLFLCTSCTRELAGLRQLDARLAAPVAQQKPAAAKVSLGERIGRFFAIPGRSRDFGLAFGAFVLGAFLIYGSGGGAESGVSGAHGAARFIELTAQSHSGTHIGGFVLMAVGVGLAAFSVLRKK